MAIFSKNWGGLTEENQKFQDEMFERFVPWSGKANTLGGEILRAINRIVYKFYNDGDTVDKYYSAAYNYSAAANDFLVEKVPSYKSLEGIAEDKFELKLSENFNNIIEYLKKNETLFSVPNSEDCIDNAPKSNWDEWADEEEDEDDEWDN